VLHLLLQVLARGLTQVYLPFPLIALRVWTRPILTPPDKAPRARLARHLCCNAMQRSVPPAMLPRSMAAQQWYIFNAKSQVAHRPRQTVESGPADQGRTLCGWAYARGIYEKSHQLPSECDACPRCFRELGKSGRRAKPAPRCLEDGSELDPIES
jgi:hypothetical protein